METYRISLVRVKEYDYVIRKENIPGIKGRRLMGRIKICFLSAADAEEKRSALAPPWGSAVLDSAGCGSGGGGDDGVEGGGGSLGLFDDFLDLDALVVLRVDSTVLEDSGSSELGVLFSLDSGVVLPVSPLGFSCGSFLDFEGASGEFDGEEPSPLPLLLELARIFKTELSTLESVDSGGWSAEDNEPWNGVDGLGRRFKGTSLIRDSSF